MTKKLRDFVYSTLEGSGWILVISSLIASVFNFLYNAYLGRVLKVEDFGLVSLIGSFLLISNIPQNSLSRTITYKTAFFLGKYDTPIKNFWRYVRRSSIIVSIVATVIWLASAPFLAKFFHSQSILPFILFAPAIAFGTVSAVDSAFLSGNLKFK